MNVKVQRYLPPILVLGAAAFFGWPPSKPLDLGEDIVRASSVRWRAEDLDTPPLIQPPGDPFKAVLVVSEAIAEANEPTVEIKPSGPPEEELKAGLRLDGFAGTGGRTWAVLNGRPRLSGDVVRTADANRHPCEILEINRDHVVVRCQETVTKIAASPFGTNRPAAKAAVPAVNEVGSGDAQGGSPSDPPSQQIAPPPQA